MKLKDIEVGKEYANTYGNKIVVLEVGVYGRIFPHRMVSGCRSDHKHYVRIKTEWDHEEPVHYRSIVRTWEQQEKIDKADAEIRDGKRAEVSRLWDILEKHIPGIERELYRDTNIVLNRTNVNRVCEALEKLGQPKTQIPD